MSIGSVVVPNPDPKELKEAMTQLSRAVLKVFRISSPHLSYSGALKELPAEAESVSGLHLGALGDTLLLRSGRIEIQLYPVLTDEEEARILDALLAKRDLRNHRRSDATRER